MKTTRFIRQLILQQAISKTRNEPGISIQDIAHLFRLEFDEAEIEALIKALKKELST